MPVSGPWGRAFRIIPEQVLRAEFPQNFSKCLIESGPESWLKHASARAAGEHGQGVFAADIPARFIGNGNNQNRIQDGVGGLSRAKRHDSSRAGEPHRVL